MKKQLLITLLALLSSLVSYGQDFVWHNITERVSGSKLSYVEFTSNSTDIYVRYTFPKKHEHQPGTYREPSSIDLIRLKEDGSAEECKGLVSEIHEGHILRAFRDIKYKENKAFSTYRIFLPPGMVWKKCEIGIRPGATISMRELEGEEAIVVFDPRPFKGNTASYWTSKLQLMFNCPMKIYTRAEEKENMICDNALLYIVTDEASAAELREKTEKTVLVHRAE